MLCKAQSGEKPAKVVLTALPDGSTLVALHDNIKKITVKDIPGGEEKPVTSTSYEYDETMFPLPYDRTDETVETVTEAFADWWAYGSDYTGEDNSPTLEERVSNLENTMMDLMSL